MFWNFFKEFWIFEVCNIKSIKISDILWNSGKNPWKSRRKMTDFKRFQQNFAKNLENSLNFCKILKKKSANFEIWAVRRNDNLVDLEKCWKNEYLVAKIGVDTAENEPSKVSGGSEFHPAVSHTDPTLSILAWISNCFWHPDKLAYTSKLLRATTWRVHLSSPNLGISCSQHLAWDNSWYRRIAASDSQTWPCPDLPHTP